jgi:arsenate reductase-like glutaredoxin family protein
MATNPLAPIIRGSLTEPLETIYQNKKTGQAQAILRDNLTQLSPFDYSKGIPTQKSLIDIYEASQDSAITTTRYH